MREIPATQIAGANNANKLNRLHLLFRGQGYISPVPRQLPSTMAGRLICFVAGVLAIGSGFVNAHGSHSSDQPASNDWATRHMMGTTLTI